MRLALPRTIIVEGLNHRVAHVQFPTLVLIAKSGDHLFEHIIRFVAGSVVLMRVVVEEQIDLLDGVPRYPFQAFRRSRHGFPQHLNDVRLEVIGRELLV